MAPGSPSVQRHRTKRVSPQHTLERVRNNQRRHRARRKDHVATLEQKLREAEQTIETFKDQVRALQATLTRYRHWSHNQHAADDRTRKPQRCESRDSTSPPSLFDTHGEPRQGYGALSGTEDLEARELPALAFAEPLVSDDQSGSETNALTSLLTGSLQPPIPVSQYSELVPVPPLAIEPASNRDVAEAGSLLHAEVTNDPLLAPTTPCCHIDPSWDLQVTVNTRDRMTPSWSHEGPLLMPGYEFQPAMEAYYQANPYGESTMLCSEAYILIEHQNFKGMSQGDVATWLWNSFRRSIQPGEGCRVNTDMLFSLLAFISDI